MKNKFLCIVDDDDVFQFLTIKAIKKIDDDLKVVAFSDGEKACTYLKENTDNPQRLPDVILLDINMPYMDGWSFIEEYIRLKPKLEKTIYIYMISSSVDPVDIERAERISEISDYIIKPVTTDALAQIIEQVN